MNIEDATEEQGKMVKALTKLNWKILGTHGSNFTLSRECRHDEGLFDFAKVNKDGCIYYKYGEESDSIEPQEFSSMEPQMDNSHLWGTPKTTETKALDPACRIADLEAALLVAYTAPRAETAQAEMIRRDAADLLLNGAIARHLKLRGT